MSAKFPVDKKIEIIYDCLVSRKSPKVVCKSHGVSYATMLRWRKLYFNSDKDPKSLIDRRQLRKTPCW